MVGAGQDVLEGAGAVGVEPAEDGADGGGCGLQVGGQYGDAGAAGVAVVEGALVEVGDDLLEVVEGQA
ncbi:hypothetical protein DPM19_17930 [Actinomadura craniellae]|uniref:Uncharacterized protein n=1 Tax=Actinomadura craniellae TaxID=2231787 RepID=A0A365H4W1_9ACTN|nr:hypothetical protein DPM19_17930 [Actinomadura craniellae]